jgi:acylphosphatase
MISKQDIPKIGYSGVKINVAGDVQGVGFRYFIARVANNLDLKGYAKNLYNGDVEIAAEGRKEFLEELVRKAGQGPSYASVDSIRVEWLDFMNKYHNFEIR